MAKISRDFSAGNLHPRENIALTGNIVAVNGTVTINADGCATVNLLVGAGLTATLVLEGSIDGTSWQAMPVRLLSPGGGYGPLLQSMSFVGTAAIFTGLCSMFTQVRARCTAYTSGSASVTIMATSALLSVEAILKPSDLHVTATGASGAAVTLTIPAPQTGLFHHFTRLTLERHPSALLTAAATPVIITTTNMPGSRAFSIPADAAAQGVVFTKEIEPAAPIKSAVAATATTFVAPTTTGVIWRMAADYYNAP